MDLNPTDMNTAPQEVEEQKTSNGGEGRHPRGAAGDSHR